MATSWRLQAAQTPEKSWPLQAGRHGARGARVEQVVVDLRRIEAPAVDGADDRRRFAERREAYEARQALLAHALEAVGDAALFQHVVDADRA